MPLKKKNQFRGRTMGLEGLRKKVDRIDANILRLLNQRALLTLHIGKLKAKRQEGVYVPDRESQIYARIKRLNKGPLS